MQCEIETIKTYFISPVDFDGDPENLTDLKNMLWDELKKLVSLDDNVYLKIITWSGRIKKYPIFQFRTWNHWNFFHDDDLLDLKQFMVTSYPEHMCFKDVRMAVHQAREVQRAHQNSVYVTKLFAGDFQPKQEPGPPGPPVPLTSPPPPKLPEWRR